MKVFAIVLAAFPIVCWPQTKTGEANTKAACSPAVTGNVTTLTINCTGMSKEKAEDMVRLMNRILSKQLDPKMVYSQLDKIQGALASIGDVVNPLGKASAADIALVDESQRLINSCNDFVQSWTLEVSKRQKSAASPAASSSQVATDLQENRAKIDESKAAEFQQRLASQIRSLAAQLIPQLPSPTTNPRISPWHIRPLLSPSARSSYEFAKVVEALGQIL